VDTNEGDLEQHTESIPPGCKIKSNIHENVRVQILLYGHKPSYHITD
jgi:hypothetical protein